MTHGPKLPFSESLHAEKYRGPGESFKEGMTRVAAALQDDTAHFRETREILLEQRFLPGGRIQAAIGSLKRTTPYNCFVSGTIEDSFVEGEGSIMARAAQAAATMRMGGGIGYDFSTLRPRGAPIRKLDSRSSGPMAFMDIFDAICRCVASSGHRRGAQMGVLRVDHPDIEEFIHAKQNSTRLTGFNISIAVTDEFMRAVESGSSFALRWGREVFKEVDARALFEKIMRSTWDWAEPGVLFIDAINDRNNLAYCERIAATNPCVPAGTQILTRRGWAAIETVLDEPVEVWNGEAWSSVVPRVTGVNQPLVRVELSNGKELTCTPAHVWVLEDGSRREAGELEEGDTLLVGEWPVIEGEKSIETEIAYGQGLFSGDGWLASDDRPYLSWKKDSKRALAPFFRCANHYETGEGTDDRYHFYYMKGCLVTTDKTFVPNVDWTVASRLAWLAGYFDADGTVAYSYNKEGERTSVCIQACSTNQSFLDRVELLLKTLGVDSTRSAELEPKGGYPNASPIFNLQIRSTQVAKLLSLGLVCHRLDLTGNNPQRAATRKLRVRKVSPAGRAEKVFCFTEPLRHQGCFNGVLTGQCGEQPLPPFGACLLGSFNLVKYVTAGRSFDFDLFEGDVEPIVRAMDNVVDRATYPLYEQEKEAKSKRRMGLGVTGLANAGEALGFSYGSKEFVAFEARVLTLLRNAAYRASSDIAATKGSFPLFQRDPYLAGKFVATLPDDLRERIARFGIRNSHLLSIAPTGTISLAADNVSSGIEPVFAYEVNRTYIGPNGEESVNLTDYGLREFGVRGKVAADVTIDEHLAVLITAAGLVDSAVSKTLNVPSGTPWADFQAIYKRAWAAGCKGCTTYQVGGKRAGILEAVPSKVEEEGETSSCTFDPVSGRKNCE